MFLLKCKKLDEKAKIPTRANPTDAGLDLYALEDTTINFGRIAKCRTGIAVQAVNTDWNDTWYNEQHTTYFQVVGKSGLASNGVGVLAGVIDESYTGEIIVLLTNHNAVKPEIFIPAGGKVAQLILKSIELPEIEVVETFDRVTNRGDKGFGSTGA